MWPFIHSFTFFNAFAVLVQLEAPLDQHNRASGILTQLPVQEARRT